MYNDEIIAKSENRIKTTWDIIMKETRKYKYHSKIESLRINNAMVQNSQEIAQNFNDYFSSVADTIIGNIMKDNDELKDDTNHSSYLINNFNNTFPHINWKFASTYEITKIIESLKTKNSCGYDEISVKIVKSSAPFIISPLTYICNKSGKFPERLKYALIRPVHKKGDKHLVTNYRPISLLTSFSKIFEKLVFARLYKHLLTNRILAKAQYGFRSNSSTENAAYNVINEITQAMNDRRPLGGLFCDLEKAFDCVNHKSFLHSNHKPLVLSSVNRIHFESYKRHFCPAQCLFSTVVPEYTAV